MENYSLNASEIFIVFFVMFGPLKLIGPFANATRQLANPELRALAWKTAAIAAVTALLGGFVGTFFLNKWHVGRPELMLTAGIIFFLVVLRTLLIPADTVPAPSHQGAPTAPKLFPLIVSPHGMAAAIVLIASSDSAERTSLIVALLALVMVFNLLAMLYVRFVLRGPMPLVFSALGAVLGVMQAALALQIMVNAWRALGSPLSS